MPVEFLWGLWGAGITLAGLVFHAGIQMERLRKLREEHDELREYAHRISHDTIGHLEDRFNRISLYLAKHVKNGTDEL